MCASYIPHTWIRSVMNLLDISRWIHFIGRTIKPEVTPDWFNCKPQHVQLLYHHIHHGARCIGSFRYCNTPVIHSVDLVPVYRVNQAYHMWYHMHIQGYEMYHMHVPGYEMHQIFSAEQVLGIHRKLVWSVCTSSLCLAPRKMLALLINPARASVTSYNYEARNLISDTSSSNIFQARRQNGITQAFHLLRLWKMLRASLNLIILCGLQFRSSD